MYVVVCKRNEIHEVVDVGAWPCGVMCVWIMNQCLYSVLIVVVMYSMMETSESMKYGSCGCNRVICSVCMAVYLCKCCMEWMDWFYVECGCCCKEKEWMEIYGKYGSSRVAEYSVCVEVRN